MNRILLILCSLTLTCPAVAQQVLEVDTHWTAADSPIALDQDTRLVEGAVLTIDPGVVVELAAGVSLVIEGELIARGTEAEPIAFVGAPTADGPARWASLVFENTSVDASYEALDDYRAGCILEHCHFSAATRAVVIRRASPFVHFCEFESNAYEYDLDTQGGAAIQVQGGSGPRIQACTFRDNLCTSAGEGGAIHVELAEPILQDNLFEANRSGYGGALTTYNFHGPVVGNTFDGNGSAFEGGAMAFVSSTPSVLNNTVTNNRTLMDGAGVHVCTTCYPHANPLLLDNTITDNTSDLDGGAGVGAAYLRICSHNDLHDNQTAGQPADFAWFNEVAAGYPDWVAQPDVRMNWWGTIEAGPIEATLHDGRDDPAYGQIRFEPVADGPIAAPRTRVTVTTQKIRYAESGEPMPVYLTVYNPGLARRVDLVLLVQAGDHPPLPYQGPLDFPGAERLDGAFRLDLPDNAVYFGIPIQPAFEQAVGVDTGAWHAALFDADSGEPIGQAITIQVSYGEGAE